MSLLTVKQVQDWVPQASGEEALIADAITMAEGLADQACSRTLEAASVTEYFDVGEYQSSVVLGRYPVVSVTSVVEDASDTSPTTLTSSDYILDTPSGILRRDGASWPVGARSVAVTYTGGYTTATLPAGLRRALLQLVAWVFEDRGNVGAVNDQTDGHSVTFDEMDGPVPKRIAQALAPWKVRRIG